MRLFLTALLCVFASCTAKPPVGPYFDTGVVDRGRPDIPANCPAVPTLAAPVIKAPASPTPYEQQPFRGSAPGAAMITAKGPLGNAAPRNVTGVDGSFCIEVRLLKDTDNSVTFTALDAQGCPGKSTTITLRHKSVPKGDGGVTTVINVAKDAKTTSSIAPANGTIANVTDGSLDTQAKLSFFDNDVIDPGNCDKFAWVRVDLGKAYTISRIKVHWAANAGSDYGRCFSVMLASGPNAGDPDPKAGDWIVVHQAQTADSKAQDIVINPETAQSAALLLYEDGSTSAYETFQVAELEVYGQDPNAVPPPPPDRCE